MQKGYIVCGSPVQRPVPVYKSISQHKQTLVHQTKRVKSFFVLRLLFTVPLLPFPSLCYFYIPFANKITLHHVQTPLHCTTRLESSSFASS